MADFLAGVIRARHRRVLELPPLPAFPPPAVMPFDTIFPAWGAAVIAEIKPVSPAAGSLVGRAEAAGLASLFARCGASAISVLTEPDHFGGSFELLAAVAAGVDLPTLAKDIVVDPLQVLHARAAGASSILLMTEVLDDAQLRMCLALARSLGMEPLVEVGDREGLARALAAGASIVGVNARDLHTLEMHPQRHDLLIGEMPAGIVPVAASGIGSPGRARDLAAMGYRGLLVGTALLQAADAESQLVQLVAAAGGAP